MPMFKHVYVKWWKHSYTKDATYFSIAMEIKTNTVVKLKTNIFLQDFNGPYTTQIECPFGGPSVVVSLPIMHAWASCSGDQLSIISTVTISFVKIGIISNLLVLCQYQYIQVNQLSILVISIIIITEWLHIRVILLCLWVQSCLLTY